MYRRYKYEVGCSRDVGHVVKNGDCSVKCADTFQAPVMRYLYLIFDDVELSIVYRPRYHVCTVSPRSRTPTPRRKS